jgi:type I restriction enzyme S subunit
MSERLRGIGSTNQGNVRTPRVNADDLGSIIVDLPTIRQQRAIADYLDIKTARVDALITKKRCMIELAGARYRSTLEQIFERLSSPTAALGRFVVSLTQGVSPQADNAPATTNEYGLLKLSAVKHGRYLPGENKALPSEFVVRPDLVPQRGDLMVTRSNTPAYVGDACVVDLEARVVLCDLIYRIRLNEHLIPQFAALALLRSGARRHLSSAARGTSQSMVKLRGEDIKATPIPVPPLAIQRGIVEEAAAAERIDSRLKGCLRRQIALLQEHQQALIAAAVTGEIEVPGAA